MHQSSPTNWKLLGGFALAGLASGLLSVISCEVLSNIPRLENLSLGSYVPGAMFGLIVSACSAICFGIRSWARLLAFIAASIGACFLAVELSTSGTLSFLQLDQLLGDSIFYVSMFLSGMLGAFIVLAAAQLFFSPGRHSKTILSAALLWSLVGGALGVAGWALGDSVGKVLWVALHAIHLTASDPSLEAAVEHDIVNFFSLFVLWQACIAPVVGWLIAKSSARQSERNAAASA